MLHPIEENGEKHYCLIKNLSRLLSNYKTSHNGKHFFCDSCLSHYTSNVLLEEHQKYCLKASPQAVYMPEKDKAFMKFTNWQNCLLNSFVIYADFESFNEKHQKPASYAYYVVSNHPGYLNKGVQLYRGSNVIEHFLTSLKQEESDILNLLSNIKQLNLSVFEQNQFENATICHICKNDFNIDDKNERKCRDHCHITGKYRGAAHNKCNLNYRICVGSYKIPIFFHNGKKYDFHLFVKELGKFVNVEGKFEDKIKVIPQNIENYLQISWGKHIIFKDSIQFLSMSLEKLSNSLNDENCINLNKHFGNNYELMTRKGIFPYSWFTDKSKFNELILPPINEFHNSLDWSKIDNIEHKETISENDYKYANKVWNQFNCRNFGDFHDLYLQTDVLLLADVFECFRKNCMNNFEIDPSHYVTLPAFGWDAMLKMTKVKLDLLTDVNMYNFFTNGVRGGISTINHRYAKANNPYVSDYNTDQPLSYIIYMDKNSLYSEAMIDYLPYACFKWEEPTNFDRNFILNLPDDNSTGYIFEVDLDYPESLHDVHNSYPLAPEHLTIEKHQLSLYSMTEKYHSFQKLVPNLFNKTNYIVNYRNLKFYLKFYLLLNH